MENNKEYLLFLKELWHLQDEYQRCMNKKTKKQIADHIRLLERAIDLSS